MLNRIIRLFRPTKQETKMVVVDGIYSLNVNKTHDQLLVKVSNIKNGYVDYGYHMQSSCYQPTKSISEFLQIYTQVGGF